MDGGYNKMRLRKFAVFFLFLIGAFTVCSFKVLASPIVNRFAGTDRYSTAVEISKNGWQSSNYVIIVSGENFPDALCSAPLAEKYDAPILLTQATGMTTAVIQEIQRLGAKNAIIIGGTGAVSADVEDQLKGINVTYTRIQGVDRYETSLKIAQAIGTSNGVVIASGENFPDALSIAPIAASEQMPILLIKSDVMPDNIKSFIQSNSSNKYYVIGGTGVINDSAINGISNLKRLGGTDRYQTNMLIINEFTSDEKFNSVYVATGENFADAIGGAAAAAKTSSPIILVNNSTSEEPIIESNVNTISNINILGGTAVISDVLVQNLLSSSPSSSNTTSSKKVCIDPGLNEYDSNAAGPMDPVENNIDLAIALKVGSILQQNGIQVIYTRTNSSIAWPSDITADLQSRCDTANNANVNYFVTINSNSSDGSAADGIETSYCTGSEEGEELAQSIQDALVKSTGLQDEKIKPADYYVLENTNAPAIITGLASMSNSSEKALLATDDFQNKCAQAIASAIVNSLAGNSSKPTTPTTPTIPSVPNNQTPSSDVVMGYAVKYSQTDKSSYNSIEANGSSLNEVATDTFDSDSEGNLTGTVPADQVDLANSSGIKSLALVTNSFSYAVSQTLLESPTNRQNLINNILASIETNNYTGVNIDFEDIYAGDRDNFTEFMKELYNALHPKAYMVTVSVPAKTEDDIIDNWNGAYDYANIAKYSDQIVLMAYDEHYAGGSPGPIASSDWVNKVVQYAAKVIPSEKILLGVADYGYDWSNDGNSAKAYSEQQAYNMSLNMAAPIQWDETSESPYYTYTDINYVHHTVWFENGQSVGYKLDIIKNNNLGGIAIWRLGLENSDIWSSIKEKLNK